jgi:hypothetical protein
LHMDTQNIEADYVNEIPLIVAEAGISTPEQRKALIELLEMSRNLKGLYSSCSHIEIRAKAKVLAMTLNQILMDTDSLRFHLDIAIKLTKDFMAFVKETGFYAHLSVTDPVQ